MLQCLCFLLFGTGIQPVAALTISGNLSPAVPVVVRDQCPDCPDLTYITTATNAEVLSTGYNSGFQTAWNTILPGEWDSTGWTLSFSDTPIQAELNIATYHAYDDNSSTGLGGAEINISWTPTAGQQNLKWIQAIHTNRPRHESSEWYLDVLRLRKELPPVYPYSYSDYHFYDKPGRYFEPGEYIYWNAYLYLANVDRNTKSVVVYEGLSWGFTINCVTVPEPSSILIIITGLTGIITRKKALPRS